MRKTLVAVLALLALGAVPAVWMVTGQRGSGPAEALGQVASPADCAAGTGLVLRLGLGDTAETDWSGTASGWVGDGASWEAKSESSPLKLPRGGRQPRILPAEVHLGLPAAPCGSVADSERAITVDTGQGSFEIKPLQLAMGVPATYLDGRAEVARVPSAQPVASNGLEEDFPHCTGIADDGVLCVYVEYEPGEPVDEEAALAGDFGSIEFDGNGDRVALIRRTAAGWSEPAYLTGAGRDVWRPVVTARSDGGATVLWSEQRDGNWDIYARDYSVETSALSPEERLTTDPGADFNVAASGDYFAWQGRRQQGFDIFAARIGQPAVRVSTSDANDWRPSISTDSKGAAWIAWDTYDAGNYDVLLRQLDGSELGEPIAVAQSPRFEARASVAVDPRDRVWVAFEDSGEGWGKDAGDRWTGRQALSMYVSKRILVRVWDGRLRRTETAPRAPLVDYHHDDTFVGTSRELRISIPTIAFDGGGQPWVFFRRHPLETGAGERWRGYASHYSGASWSAPIPLLGSDHLLDRQPGIVATADGGLLAVSPGDKRTSNVRSREDSDLVESRLRSGSAPAAPELASVDPSEPHRRQPPVHPDEAEQVAGIRERRVNASGKTLRFLRGEFHRHTEFSAHRDWDGPFEEVWRYALDVADMDWIGPGDHDYATGQNYLWWLQQKASDMYHDPGRFAAMYTYERSQRYPSGHRNVMLPRRGIRPLPRMRGNARIYGTEERGSPDIRNLYAYLEHFAGICSSHTSATNMGTDWRDAHEELEPVVELFQGHRQSYEVSGGPGAATGPEDTIQGYEPLGFVWEAFKKGRRLGFQASSDHVSTHISYAIVLAEENSREGIIRAFQQRHSYAAHDNIALVVRSGDYLMGDEFTTSDVPRLSVVATGTAPIERVDVVRQVEGSEPAVVASMEPGTVEIDLEWADPAAEAGKTTMYYVRLEQSNAAMAWASPMWIRYEP